MNRRLALSLVLSIAPFLAFASCSEDDTKPPPAQLLDASKLDAKAADRSVSEAASDVVTEAATPDASDAAADVGSDVTSDATDGGTDAAQDAADASDAADAADAAKWVYVGIGDCSGNDRVAYTTGSAVPVEADCDQATSGTAAVCWDQSNYTNSLVPGSAQGCTYKSVQVASCTGGSNPGYMYVCTP